MCHSFCCSNRTATCVDSPRLPRGRKQPLIQDELDLDAELSEDEAESEEVEEEEVIVEPEIPLYLLYECMVFDIDKLDVYGTCESEY